MSDELTHHCCCFKGCHDQEPCAGPQEARWTPETEALLGEIRKAHESTMIYSSRRNYATWTCPCGANGGRIQDKANARQEALTHERRAILAALADAGLLVVPARPTGA